MKIFKVCEYICERRSKWGREDKKGMREAEDMNISETCRPFPLFCVSHRAA